MNHVCLCTLALQPAWDEHRVDADIKQSAASQLRVVKPSQFLSQ